jgi:glycosyltransferase involved in cell wall biosynthesis
VSFATPVYSTYLAAMQPEDNRLYKILVISDYRDVNSSRPEAEIFIQLAQAGHTIYIVSYPAAEYYNDRFKSFGIEVIAQHPQKKAYLPDIRFLRTLIREKRFDIVHAFNSYGLTNAIWSMIKLPAKLIAYRGYAGQTYWYDPMMYVKYFHPRVDHIICLSDEIKNILSHHMPWGKSKLTTIHKGHDPKWYRYVPKIDRKSLAFSDNDILICCVANVRPFKGIPCLIQATYLLPADTSIRLILIGNGYGVGTVKNLIDNSPHKDRIHILGYRKDSLSIVATSDATILSSTHGEALTKSVIESMCLGIPPIITDIPGNRGLVVDKESGWVVAPKNAEALAQAMQEAASDKNERERRGQNAIRHIEDKFPSRKTVSEFLTLYKKLMEDK